MPAHELQQTRGGISRGQSVLSMLEGYLNWLAWRRPGCVRVHLLMDLHTRHRATIYRDLYVVL